MKSPKQIECKCGWKSYMGDLEEIKKEYKKHKCKKQ